jgi:type I restriction enzyme S subunit
MKDSGVEWIGKVPLNWMTPKFKNLATLSNGREIEEDGGDIPVYGSGGIFKYTKRPLFEGTSLLTGRKGTIDNPMLVNGAFWTVDTMFYTSSINLKRVLPEYLFYAFKGCCNFGFYKSGSVLPSMTQTQINNITIPLPTIEEQKQILAFLKAKMEKIDSLLSLLNRDIEKLNSYKKSLIYEYVTGKKRVSL